MTDQPRWERGHRAHGYWLGMDRIGFVSRPVGVKKGDAYSWEIESGGTAFASGEEATLTKAKRALEAAWLRAQAAGWRPGSSMRPCW